jgi:hypothetical protein
VLAAGRMFAARAVGARRPDADERDMRITEGLA